MFSIVYVLISTGEDVYYKQLLISLRTLRRKMKDIPVIVLTDNETGEILKKNENAEIHDLAVLKSVKINGQYTSKERSRYLKTSLRNILDGDLLFIDCDTAICGDFSDYYNECALAMVNDENIPLKYYLNKQMLAKNNLTVGYDIEDYQNYYNSGVIWMRDLPETRQFFRHWHAQWKQELKYGNCLDQPPLNYVNEKIMPLISHLPNIWNCQVSSNPSGIQFLSQANIIHYYNFNSGPYKLADRDFVLNKMDSKEMDEVIENPRAAFGDATISAYASYNEFIEFTQTNVCRIMLYVYKKMRTLFNIFDIFFSPLIYLKEKIGK